MSPLELLKQELALSTLGSAEQIEFIGFLGRMPGRYLIDILDMAKEDPNFLSFLWSNYDKKNKAFKMHDETLLNDVLKEEKAMLEQMGQEA
jgi:hypothetical protein